MSTIWFKSTRAQAFSLLGLEILLITLISLSLLIFQGTLKAYSFALGGVVSILPNGFFIFNVFKNNKASQAKQIVKTFFRNEFVKLILMAVLFTLFISIIKLALWPFILGLLVAQMGTWLAPLLFLRDYRLKN